MGFPMEMNQNPGHAIWIVAHKPVAVAAGMGRMGIHRNVIHRKFVNFILLGTVLLDQEVDVSDDPIDNNPCLDCKLCVAACPIGAIKAEAPKPKTARRRRDDRARAGGLGWPYPPYRCPLH